MHVRTRELICPKREHSAAAHPHRLLRRACPADVAVRPHEICRVARKARGGHRRTPVECVQRQSGARACSGDRRACRAIDMDLPIECAQRRVVVVAATLRRDPWQSIARCHLARDARRQRALTILDRRLRYRAEHEALHGAKREHERHQPRHDVRAHEARRSAFARHDLEGAVGRRDKTFGKGNPLRLVGIEQALAGTMLEHGGELPGEVDRVAKAGVHSLGADGAVDVPRVTCKKDAAGAKMRGEPMVHVVRRKPVDALDSDAKAVQDGAAHVGPFERAAGAGGSVLHRADEARVPCTLHREDRQKVRGIERDVQFMVHRRTAADRVGDIEHVLVCATRKASIQYVAHARARAVAADEVRGLAALLRSVGLLQPRDYAVAAIFESGQLDGTLDRHAECRKPLDQEPLVLVLREDQHVRIAADPLAHRAERHAPHALSADPEIRSDERLTALDQRVGEIDLRVELECARLHAQRARRRAWLADLVDDAHTHAEASEPQR